MSNRTLERVLHVGYLAELDALALEALRQKRNEAQRLEDASSYLRRLVQGRLDVIGLEIRARVSDERTDVSAIVEQLPQALADGVSRTATGRLIDASAPPEEQEEWATDRVNSVCGGVDLASVPELADDTLYALTDALNALERAVSTERRRLHDVIDALQAELVKRYKSGEAKVEGLLGG